MYTAQKQNTESDGSRKLQQTPLLLSIKQFLKPEYIYFDGANYHYQSEKDYSEISSLLSRTYIRDITLRDTDCAFLPILEQLRHYNGPFAYSGVDKEAFITELYHLVDHPNDPDGLEAPFRKGILTQATANSCGPTAMVQLIAKANSVLFVRTVCELIVNGYTKAPFHLRASFWDKNALISHYSQFENIKPYTTAFVCALRHTENYLGYSHNCWFESFRGKTAPRTLAKWAKQAGLEMTSNTMTIQNHNLTKPVESVLGFGRIVIDEIPQQPHQNDQFTIEKDNSSFGYISDNNNLSIHFTARKSNPTSLLYFFGLCDGHYEAFFPGLKRTTYNNYRDYSGKLILQAKKPSA